MQLALLDPDFGYYNKPHPIGQWGTFTTAPEMTQMFGELISLVFAQYWSDHLANQEFILLELGPGRGTLMSDFLRASAIVPGFNENCDLYLLEKSKSLKAEQKSRLERYRPIWIDTLEALPHKPFFVVANEFFDALPVRQFRRGPSFWHEKVVEMADASLQFGFLEETDLDFLSCRLKDTQEGDIIEYQEDLPDLIDTTARLIKDNGGLGLIIDYGEEKSSGDTFQAIGKTGYADPLSNPGETDLTCHVDFGSMIHTAAKHVNACLAEQGRFLLNLGIQARAQQLAQNLSGLELESHWAAFNRLIHPKEMGQLFKVLALYPRHIARPEGLQP